MADRLIRGPFQFTNAIEVLVTPHQSANGNVSVVNLTTPGACSFLLPIIPAAYPLEYNGRSLWVKDGAGNAATYPITVTDPNGNTIDGASSYVISQDYGAALFEWDGVSATPQWHVLDSYGGGSLTLGQPASYTQALTSSGTITLPPVGNAKIVTTTGAVTGMILTVGTADGQTVVLINESANSVTFAASGTSNVADGTSDVVAANTARMLVWSSTTSLWYRVG